MSTITMMRQLSGAEYDAFVAAKPAAVIHFDAEWDVGNRPITRQKMAEAESELAEQVSFAEVDCDKEPELAASIPVMNIPLVAYYRDGKLVAALIGRGQNVRARVERILRGEEIGYKDRTDTA